MKYNIFTGIILLFIALLKISLMDMTFFWDNITCLSLPANFFYENKLQTLIYSGWLDNGDPHIIPYLQAAVWSLFGKSLLISHLMFLPVFIFPAMLGNFRQLGCTRPSCPYILHPHNPASGCLSINANMAFIAVSETSVSLSSIQIYSPVAFCMP